MSKIKIGDTVKVETKRSVYWVVVFRDGQLPSNAQLSATSLERIEVAS